MSFALTQLAGFGGKMTANMLVFEVAGSASSTADGASYTFSSVNIGTAATGRRVLVAYAATDNSTTTTPTDVTIGGVSATIRNYAGGTGHPVLAGFAILQVDAGTTADIVITGGANAWQNMQIQVYALYGLSSSTPYNEQSDQGTTETVNNIPINVPAGGVAFGVVVWRDPAVATTTTWTNLANEVSDGYHDAQASYSHAYEQFSSAQTVSVTATGSQAPAQWAFALISYGL